MATVLQPFSPSGFQLLADDWAELCRLHFRGPAKCIVLDCDNTLWGGIVGEDGVHGLRLGETYPGICFQQFQRQLKQLRQTGFLLALNSKNNEADVRAAFAQHPAMVLRWEDFAAVRVNWQDKAANMATLAAELNLSVDSFVFVDDNSFELELVRGAFPGLLTLAVPAEDLEAARVAPAVRRAGPRQPDARGSFQGRNVLSRAAAKASPGASRVAGRLSRPIGIDDDH